MLDGGEQTPRTDGDQPVGRYAATDDPLTTDGDQADESMNRSLDTFRQILEGGAGDDTLMGGEAAQKLDGGTGVDTADYSNVTGRQIQIKLDGIWLPGDPPMNTGREWA